MASSVRATGEQDNRIFQELWSVFFQVRAREALVHGERRKAALTPGQEGKTKRNSLAKLWPDLYWASTDL